METNYYNMAYGNNPVNTKANILKVTGSRSSREKMLELTHKTATMNKLEITTFFLYQTLHNILSTVREFRHSS